MAIRDDRDIATRCLWEGRGHKKTFLGIGSAVEGNEASVGRSQKEVFISITPPIPSKQSRILCKFFDPMLIQTWPVLRVFWHDILPHSTTTEYGVQFARPHVSKTPTIRHELIEIQPTFLTTRARVKCQASRSKWQCALRYCKDGNRISYIRFGMSRDHASPGMITCGWRGCNPCSRNPFLIKPNRQLFPRREDRGQETTSRILHDGYLAS